MFSRLVDVRVPKDRREMIEQILDGPHTLTDIVLIADRGIQTEVREVATGHVRVGRASEYRRDRDPGLRYRFRTLSGEPLTKWKVGLYEGTASELDHRERVGLPLERTVDFPAEFEVDASMGFALLDRAGWGLVTPRYQMRNAAVMGITDSRGQPVRPRDRWLVVEVGSEMEQRARDAGDLREPTQTDDQTPGPRPRGRPPKVREGAPAEG